MNGQWARELFTRILPEPKARSFKLFHTILTFKDLEKEAFWKNSGKSLLFPQCFLPFSEKKFNFSVTFILSFANSFNLDQSKNLFGIYRIISFPKKPWFSCVCCTSFLKTLQEKEKLLVKSNFSFSHSVFYPHEELSSIFIKFEIVVCKHFQFGRV